MCVEGSDVMKVPFLDLKRQYLDLKQELDEAIQDVIDSQVFILGPRVSEFEEKLSAYCGTNYAVGCSSGTDALILSLLAAGIGKGDEVITSPFTFFATAEAIIRVGAKPVFVDIREDTYNIDPDRVVEAITSSTKAIMPVHIFGQCSDMTAILEIAEKHGLTVIEDAAQAIGAEWGGKKSGSMGKFGCFSFFPAKNLGCFGDAGAVVTSCEESYKKMISLRQHGLNPDVRYDHLHLGGNFRIDALQASVLKVKLKYIDKWNEIRSKNASLYSEKLQNTNVILPFSDPRGKHVFNQYTVRSKNRENVRERLLSLGVPTVSYYPHPVSNRKAIPKQYRTTTLEIPVCDAVCKEVFSIPVFPDLTEKELIHVADCILDSCRL